MESRSQLHTSDLLIRSPEETEVAVRHALRVGYRHVSLYFPYFPKSLNICGKLLQTSEIFVLIRPYHFITKIAPGRAFSINQRFEAKPYTSLAKYIIDCGNDELTIVDRFCHLLLQ